jgi:hypothetical protein
VTQIGRPAPPPTASPTSPPEQWHRVSEIDGDGKVAVAVQTIELRVLAVQSALDATAEHEVSIGRSVVRAAALILPRLAPELGVGQHERRVRLARLEAQPKRLPIWQYKLAHVCLKELGRQMAAYFDKILKGAKPGELSIEQMSKYELVIDLRVAPAMGLNVPSDLLLRADEVIR